MNIIDDLQELIGAKYVLTGRETERFSHDWSGQVHWTPICVVRPASTEEISALLKLTYDRGIPVVPVSGNTSSSCGAYAEGAVMVSLDRLSEIISVNPAARTATVEAGVIVETLHAVAAEQGLIFPLHFGAQGSALVGGALATNAGGANVLRYGNVRTLCLGVEAVLPNGHVLNLMTELHKDNSGYDLRDLLIGSEGTLGIITKAVLRLHPSPNARATAMIGCRSLGDALQILNRLQASTGGAVDAFECMPDAYIDRHIEVFPDARRPFVDRHAFNILIELSSSRPGDALEDREGIAPLASGLEDFLADQLGAGLLQDAVISQSEAQRSEMWQRRHLAAELTLTRHPVIDNDVSVPLDQIEAFLEQANSAVGQVDPGAIPLWVSHLGDGNVHYTVQMTDKARYNDLMDAIGDVIQRLSGSFSAEHGIGYYKREHMRQRKDPVALAMMQSIKQAIDPKGLMNPNKIFPEADR